LEIILSINYPSYSLVISRNYKICTWTDGYGLGAVNNLGGLGDYLYPLSNINDDIIYRNLIVNPGCFPIFFEGNFFWNLKKNSVVKIKAINSGGRPNINSSLFIKILKR
jgi:hypothetical protein